jgi:ribonuclease HII
VCPDLALVDGNRMPDLGVETRTIVRGDSLSASIAAASILAKVSRDRLLRRIDEIYPQYGFAKHKGYGTAFHVAMLKKYGPCPVHRMTFLKKILGESAHG